MAFVVRSAVFALSLILVPAGATAQGSRPAVAAARSPQQVADELLAADGAFAAAAANVDAITAISAQFHDDVVMPLPNGSFARGRAAAIQALNASPVNATARVEWTPVRVGVSADGQHGFSFGFTTLRPREGAARLGKYLSYWVRTPQGWRVAAYKRAPRPEGEVATALMAPALPARLVRPTVDPRVLRARREGLRAAEQAFSDQAQRIGLSPAFRANGSDDAMNMGRESGFTIGARAIGDSIGSDAPPSPVTWGADDVLVASSGDLGVTFGMIRPNGPVPEGRPAASPFFTIWRRSGPNERWRYIAE
jgi:ketosteroid isomerase-like protein